MAGSIGNAGRFLRIGPAQVLAIAITIVLAACISPRIHVDASAPEALRNASAIRVRLAAPTSADARFVLSQASPDVFLDRVREALRAGDHPVQDEGRGGGHADEAPGGAGPVTLELALLEQAVTRRTYTADTDANGARLEERNEGIVVLRALEADGRTEIWRCTARSLLPKPDAPFGPTGVQVFERLLDRALERIPTRS